MIKGLNNILYYIKMSSKKNTFKDMHSFEKRKAESSRMRHKFPDKIPIIVEKDVHSKNVPNIDKNKYLVPDELIVGQFLHIIRKRIKLSAEKGLFIFINGSILPPTASLISNIYAEYVDDDGFLYLTYSGDNVFGIH